LKPLNTRRDTDVPKHSTPSITLVKAVNTAVLLVPEGFTRVKLTEMKYDSSHNIIMYYELYPAIITTDVYIQIPVE
jgi:hypothetical protein